MSSFTEVASAHLAAMSDKTALGEAHRRHSGDDQVFEDLNIDEIEGRFQGLGKEFVSTAGFGDP